MIGTSLSRCVADIAEGKVAYNDVQKIISRTSMRTVGDFNEVVSQYTEVAWASEPSKCFQIMCRLIADNKLEQPKLYGQPSPIGTNFWVQSEDEITWSDQ